MKNGSFKNRKGFTTIQNSVARDANLSHAAKGLFILIASYITMPDKVWTKDDFLAKSREGKKAFNSHWDELKNAGYLRSHIHPEGGCFWCEYELLDEPDGGPSTIYYNANGQISSTRATVDDKRIPQKRCNGVGSNDKSDYAIGDNDIGVNIDKTMDVNTQNKDFIINLHNKHDEDKDTMSKYIEDLKRKYDYTELVDKHIEDSKIIDFIFDTIADVICHGVGKLRIGNYDRPYDWVTERLNKLTKEDIDDSIIKLKKATSIKNPRNYALAVLINEETLFTGKADYKDNFRRPLTTFHQFDMKHDYDYEEDEKMLLRRDRPVND